MSTELESLENTGSRKVKLLLTRYYGGDKNGVCLQITGI